MTTRLVGLCSMAPHAVLAELMGVVARDHGLSVDFRAGGGVAIADEVRGGAVGDVLVLAAEALERLTEEGLLLPGSARPLFVSEVVAAAPAHVPAPAIGTEAELREAAERARTIAISTGPSGVAIRALLARWGVADAWAPRIVEAPPGVPVGSMLTRGDADLGFQQLSELAGLDGVQVLGPLPGSSAIRSTFGGAVLRSSSQPGPAGRVLDLVAGLSPIVEAHGMTPTGPRRR
ncbi:MAG: substrate-binding domain-containing protein [Aeromicrobium sp.]|uniref:substrate-binding domain-containing protein n=1 Tax=Aeromicrobium sp. TaxID=1871063 RepID=UPI0026057BF2|nr:substrate-binding domain-containing protein [Aeromicrobium sp.]MDF1706409.1 substrate-binding domain-containing protein [Aeromicrobium sp.]